MAQVEEMLGGGAGGGVVDADVVDEARSRKRLSSRGGRPPKFARQAPALNTWGGTCCGPLGLEDGAGLQLLTEQGGQKAGGGAVEAAKDIGNPVGFVVEDKRCGSSAGVLVRW
ncbi:hypothetical protein GCM10020001_111900 [Nonomuraea salmonea]